MAKSRKQRKRKPQAAPVPGSNAASQQAKAAAEGRHNAGAVGVPAAGNPGLASSALAGQHFRWQRLDFLLLGVLAAMMAVAYWPALFAVFFWDDSTFITESAQMLGLSGLADIWFNPAGNEETHYWPLVYTSFWLEHKLWGFDPFGYHLVNLLLHGANTLLLWRLLVRMAVPGAWLAAALFALHPVHVEAVAWAIARKDLLASFFYLLAGACWLRYREAPRAGIYLALLAAFAAGMLSKSLTITLPAMLLVWVWWQHGRIGRQDLLQVAPVFLVGMAIAAFSLYWFISRTFIEYEYSLPARFIIASKALWFYAGKILWPYPLSLLYPHWDVEPTRLLNWLALPAALAVAISLWLAQRRIGRGPLAAALFFAITLSPVLGFANNSFIKFSFVADRYQYLASAGLITLLAAAAFVAYRRLAGAWAGYAAQALAALLLAGCGLLTFQRAQLFQDEVTLYRNAVATKPGTHDAWFMLGNSLHERELREEAADAYRAAVELKPDHLGTYANLGSVLMDLERFQEAKEVLRLAKLHIPEDLDAVKDPYRTKRTVAGIHINFGRLLQELEQLPEAEASFIRALNIDAESQLALQNLVEVLRQQGRPEKAYEWLQQAADILPEPPVEVYLLLAEVARELGYLDAAQAYSRQALASRTQAPTDLGQQAAILYNAGQYEEALSYYQQALAEQPSDPTLLVSRGITLEQLGRMAAAMQSYQQALAEDPVQEQALGRLVALQQEAGRADIALALSQRLIAIDPDNIAALMALGSLHFSAGRYTEALTFYQQVTQLDPENADAHANLGSVLGQLGRFREAVDRFERALAIDPQQESALANIALARRMLGTAK